MRLITIMESIIDDEVKALMNRLEERYGVELWIHHSNSGDGAIILSKIVVPKKMRDLGTGTKVLQEICDFADEKKLRIALTPSSDFGGSKSRLEKFYREFGFRKYKGYDYKESMIRAPSINEAKTWNTKEEMLDLPGRIQDEFAGAKFIGQGGSKIVFDIGDKVLRIANRFNDQGFEQIEKQAIKDFKGLDGAIIEVYSVDSTALDEGTVFWSIAEKVTPVRSDKTEVKALTTIAKEIESVIGRQAMATMVEDRGEADAITLLWVYRNTGQFNEIKEAITDKDRLGRLLSYMDKLADFYGKYYEDINARNTSIRENGEYTMHDV